MPRLFVVPAFLLVIPAPVGINIRTFPLSSFPRRRESSEESYDHVVGRQSFLMILPTFASIYAILTTMTSTKQPCVYILASKRNGTLYTGVTSDLAKRVWEHRNHVVEGFTKRYRVALLVWYELHTEMVMAITREKQIKRWPRAWKIALIEKMNPSWEDLWPTIIEN